MHSIPRLSGRLAQGKATTPCRRLAVRSYRAGPRSLFTEHAGVPYRLDSQRRRDAGSVFGGVRMTALLFTRDENGLQAWPDDHTTIAIPAMTWVEVTQNRWGDSAIRVPAGYRRDEVCLYI